MAKRRGQFGSRVGFVLAAAGSAIGLSVMLAEFAIGRASEKNPVGAFCDYPPNVCFRG